MKKRRILPAMTVLLAATAMQLAQFDEQFLQSPKNQTPVINQALNSFTNVDPYNPSSAHQDANNQGGWPGEPPLRFLLQDGSFQCTVNETCGEGGHLQERTRRAPCEVFTCHPLPPLPPKFNILSLFFNICVADEHLAKRPAPGRAL